MRKSYRILLAVGIILGLVFVVMFFFSGFSGNPRLAVRYLAQTNDSGRLIVFFAVTNSGNSPAICFGTGSIEMFGGKKTQVACRSSHHRLIPGEGDVLQAIMPSGMAGRWRFTALYAHVGPRSRIYDFQWGRNGPGARMNWLVPNFLKGVPMDVVATSEWMGDGELSNTAAAPGQSSTKGQTLP